MVSSVYVVFSVFFVTMASCESSDPTIKEGTCPDIQPYGDKFEPEKGADYYRLYSSSLSSMERCVTKVYTDIDGDKSKATISGYDSAGNKINQNINVVKTGDGKVRNTPASGNESWQEDDVLLVEQKDYVLDYSCKNLPDGKYKERANISSRSKTIPDNVLQNFNNYLKKKGSKLGDLLKVSQDNCE